MKKGVFPVRTKDWPLPNEVQAPNSVLPYLINGEVIEDLPCLGR